MANRTAWTAGNGAGYTFSTLFAATDLTSLPSGSSVMSSNGAITNQTAQDMLMDVSYSFTVASITPAAGSGFTLYIAYLNQDGTTYGSGEISTAGSGGAITRAPTILQFIPLPVQITSAATVFVGNFTGFQIAPGSFLPILFNNLGETLSATNGNNIVKYRTYNVNLNN